MGGSSGKIAGNASTLTGLKTSGIKETRSKGKPR